MSGLHSAERWSKGAHPKRLNIALAFAVVLVFAFQPSDDPETGK
jgi:hypothetical protein